MSTIITANEGPALPLLMRYSDEDVWPIYTGPLGAARLLVSKGYHIVEVCRFGKWGAFVANDPEGQDVMEFSVSYESEERALREALGVHFARVYEDSVTLAVALRHAVMEQLAALEGATVHEARP